MTGKPSCMSLFLTNFPGHEAWVTKSFAQTALRGNTPSYSEYCIIRSADLQAKNCKNISVFPEPDQRWYFPALRPGAAGFPRRNRISSTNTAAQTTLIFQPREKAAL